MVRVAVFEPDVLLRELLIRLLASAGHEPVPLEPRTATTASPALRVAAVILDLDGWPEGIAAPPVLPEVPAVLLASEPDRAPWRPGRCQVVQKPCHADELLDAVAAMARRIRRRRPRRR
jgi:hypothetical protein